MTTSPVRIQCPKCSVTLQIKAGSSGSLIVCPKCSQQIRIKLPAASGGSVASGGPAAAPKPVANPQARSAATQPTKPTAPVRQPAAQRPAVQRPAASAPVARQQPARPAPPAAAASGPLDWDAMPAAPAQPAGFQPAGQPFPGQPFPGQPFPGPAAGIGRPIAKSGAARSGGGGGALKKVLIAVGALAGLGVILFVGLLALVAFAGSRSDPSQKLALNGWAVDAPGRRVENSNAGGATTRGTVHSKTNSEFSIAVKTVARPGDDFNVDTIVDLMRTTGITFSGRRPVQRAGLDGVHAVMRPPVGPEVEVEILKLDATQVLLLTYVTAESKEKAAMGTARQPTADLTRKLDDPESFFASLRRDG